MEGKLNVKLFKCNKCKYSFINKEKLRRHQRQCKNKICTNCKSEFREVRDLVRHEKNRKNIKCTHCDKNFCNNEHFQKHLRTIKEPVEENLDLNIQINPSSGYEDSDGYKETLKKYQNDIQSYEKSTSRYKI